MNEKTTKPTICLVMIVKNESAVIRRCLDSVAKYINYWVIVDTGSTDGTQEIIKTHMAELGIKGSLYEREWKDYGTNRTESLQLSAGKCDYRLVIDADDYLEVTDPSVFDNLTEDAYRIPIELGTITYFRIQLVRSTQKWRYVGVLHEYIDCIDGEHSESELIGAKMIAGVSGDTRDIKGPEKYHNDALIFEKELITNQSLDEGLRSRYWFYCAQSYKDAGMYDRSLAAYTKRVQLGGWDEEVYMSLFNIAKLKGALGKPIEEIERALLAAWEYRPVRLEAVYELIKLLLHQKRFFYAFSLGNIALRMGPCNDVLFVEHDIWRWKFIDDYSVCCFNTGNLEEAIRCTKSLMSSPVYSEIPQESRDRIEKNHESFEKAIEAREKYMASLRGDSEDQPVQAPVTVDEELPKLGDI